MRTSTCCSVNGDPLTLPAESLSLACLPETPGVSYSGRLCFWAETQTVWPSSSGPTPTTSGVQTTTAAPLASTDPASHSANGGLSQSATIAIAVAVPVGLVVLVAAVGYFLWSRNRRAHAAAREPIRAPAGPATYCSAKPIPADQARAELPDGYLGAELPSPVTPVELPSPVELPAAVRQHRGLY